MTEPIRPQDVETAKRQAMPDEVMEAFNELIATKLGGNRAVVIQKDAARLILKKMRENGRQVDGRDVRENDIYANHWLDVEDIYRKAGWKVEYDKPGFNESYEASFCFSKGK